MKFASPANSPRTTKERISKKLSKRDKRELGVGLVDLIVNVRIPRIRWRVSALRQRLLGEAQRDKLSYNWGPVTKFLL